jgi:hypothetical protein
VLPASACLPASRLLTFSLTHHLKQQQQPIKLLFDLIIIIVQTATTSFS